MDDMLEELRQAEVANTSARPCQVCEALAGMDEARRSAVERGLSGTIGRDKLVTILTFHGYEVGRRAIEKHRNEEHQ